jgi:hypothetical protein
MEREEGGKQGRTTGKESRKHGKKVAREEGMKGRLKGGSVQRMKRGWPRHTS